MDCNGCGRADCHTAVQAATVSWSAEQITATGTDQISTDGMCIEAAVLSNGGEIGVTVGDVTFERLYYSIEYASQTYMHSVNGDPDEGLLYASGWVPDGSYALGVNPAYTNLFDDYRYTGGAKPLTLTNLVVGQEYLLQLFVADLRNLPAGNVDDRYVKMDGIAFPATGLIGADGDGSGTIVSGTFTADATTQTFTMSIYDIGEETETGWNIGAYQVRLLSADIPWNAQQITATGTDQISTNGTLLEAAYFGNSANGTTDKTVGGVTFQSGTTEAGLSALNHILFPSLYSYNAFYPTGNADLANLLSGARYSNATDAALTLTNLVVGQVYELQLFCADTRDIATIKTRTVELGGHVLAQGGAGLGDTGVNALGNGTVVTAVFTASATSYDIILNMWRPDVSAYGCGFQLNAYQVRDVTSTMIQPLPATVILFADGSNMTITVGDMEEHSVINNILQMTTNLVSGTWSNLYSVSGVASTNWTLPITGSQAFFRVLSSN